jgi:hypothetical protein
MKRYLLLALSVALCSGYAISGRAQGGIGNMPREDLVMLRAVVQDSLAGEAFAKVMQLKRYAAGNMIDSAALIIAHAGGPAKEERWARTVSLANDPEKVRAAQLLEKLNKLFVDFPEQEKLYYAVFKDKDNPAGQKHFLKIRCKNGKKMREMSLTFFPIGDQLMLGEVY